MNLPNRLTLLRFVLAFILIFLYVFPFSSLGVSIAEIPTTGFNVIDLVCTILFIVASITDLLDGKIARKRNLVTNFGKFMDPLADKLLVCSAMICFIELDKLPAWIVIIIIGREFIISGFRLIAAENGIVIAANYWGKFKTVSQMIMIILLLIDLGGAFDILEQIFIWLSVALTIISLITYIWQNKNVLSMQD